MYISSSILSQGVHPFIFPAFINLKIFFKMWLGNDDLKYEINLVFAMEGIIKTFPV